MTGADAWFEERDLIAQFGQRYRACREQVGMLVPKLRARSGTTTDLRQLEDQFFPTGLRVLAQCG